MGPLAVLLPTIASGLLSLFGIKKQNDQAKQAQASIQPLQQAQTDLMQFQLNRARQTDPAFQALLKMAQSMAPVYAQGQTPQTPQAPRPVVPRPAGQAVPLGGEGPYRGARQRGVE